MVLEQLKGLQVNVPVLGSVGIVGIATAAVLIWALFFRKKGRVTSVTTRFGKN